jgi:hypothetical protein
MHPKGLWRRLGVVLASLALVFTVNGLSTSSVAHAAYGCSGSLIDTYNVKTSSGVVYGRIRLYYSSASGGTNCAVMVSTTAGGYGVDGTYLSVHLRRCAQTVPGSTCTVTAEKREAWYFIYYAGPVKVTSTAGRCVWVTGTVFYKNKEGFGTSSPRASHCG